MKKAMKRCVGLLMATLMLCSSFSAYAADVEEDANEEGAFVEISELQGVPQYYRETEDEVISMSLREEIVDIYVNRWDGKLLNAKIENPDYILMEPEEVFEDARKALDSNCEMQVIELEQEENLQPFAVSDSTVRNLLISKHGSPYNGKLIYGASGPNNVAGKITESLTYGVGERLSVYLEAGIQLSKAAALLGLPQAQVLALIGSSYIVNSVLVKALNVEIYHATAMWTKTVYVNNQYQYYAGKDITYRVGTFMERHTGLQVPTTVKHSDFDNNQVLMQKGFQQYGAY